VIARRLAGSRCLCRTCGEVFNSVTAFDAHRVGPYRQFRDPLTAPDRRCLTATEMAAADMSRNPRGYWVTETRAQRRERSGSRGRAPRSGDRTQPIIWGGWGSPQMQGYQL
jgi:hypothetical protein